ncbi:MAG: bifunctional 5,10-methylenetetrahydrofolate dehydrogenase/5,10-methenyltetrahydrofolate cyclohydrolase [Candidatus Omnitrophota bacterium]
MSAKLIDGNWLANQLKEKLKKDVDDLKAATGRVPTLVNLMIGDDGGSCAYAQAQKKAAEFIGVDYQWIHLPYNISQEDFMDYVNKLNHDPKINGILIHRPVPEAIDYRLALSAIDIHKDIEGINAVNIGRMLLGETTIIPCTPAAVMALIKSTGLTVRGKDVVIVGHSDIVGKPLALLLLRELATVTICHIATSEAGRLKEHVAQADILIVAVGQADLIKGDWIKEGACVIDVGINKAGSKIVGDVEFEEAKKRASYIAPVPGGVGPMTVMLLMKNGIEVFKLQTRKE